MMRIWLSILGGLSLMACSSTAQTDLYTGYYRQGFEQSDFYTLDGRGPYWFDGTEEVFTRLQDFIVPKEGRGSYIVVMMTVEGELQEDGEFGHIGRYSTQLYANRILSIEAISQAAYDGHVDGFRT
ncbi:hypothetical protein ACFFUB_10925 [Algimonas porphyrae]|nr:hypothetical protein [Algimonas porphyrae]